MSFESPQSQEQSAKEQFINALEKQLSEMEKSGMISALQAQEKREAAALIETNLSNDPEHDALIFSRAGIAGEEEMIKIFDGNNKNEDSEDNEREEIESLFGKTLRCFKHWAQVGTAVGAVLVVGGLAKESHENDNEYDTYASSILTGEQLKHKESLETQIREVFGESAITDIYFGDRSAYFERKEIERKEPEISGFAERGWTNMQQYAFTEKYLSYPKGWIAGEVGQVEFVNSLNKKSKDHFLGGQLKQNTFSKPTMYLYRHWDESEKEEKYSPIQSKTIEHELGHANDWETDMDLNIIDRQELLIQIHKRLIATNSWHRDNDHYHENFADGSKEGLYKSAREYWAEICAEYFSDPTSFINNHPDDFKLVDEYVKKNDHSFDIFNKDRGAFDTMTGKLKEIWKDK